MQIPVITSYNGKGINQATKGLSIFERGVRNLGFTFASVFAMQKIEQFGKASVTAFANDQKQVEILNNSLKNVGFGALSQSIDENISKMSLASGVAKADLIPAFQQLLIATGSVSAAEDALNIARNVSAGTGKDLSTVTTALSKAYLGNTTSLTRLGGGLDKALLKSGDMVAINQKLTDLFHGDAAIAADSWAGKLAIIGTHAESDKVLIGGALVDAVNSLGNTTGADGLTSTMDNLATTVARVIDLFGQLGGAVGKINTPVSSWVDKIDNALFGKSFMTKFDQMLMGTPATTNTFANGHSGGLPPGSQVMANKADAIALKNLKIKEAKIISDANASRAKELLLLASKNKLSKLDSLTTQLKNKFDLNRIEIETALANTTDARTKAALEGQLALLDANNLNTDASTKLVQASLNQLDKLDKLSSKTTSQIDSVTHVTDVFTKLGFVSSDLAASLSANALDMRTLHDSYAGGSGSGIANANISANANINQSNGADTNGGGRTVVVAPLVVPTIVTDTPGFTAAVQGAVQKVVTNGDPVRRGSNDWS